MRYYVVDVKLVEINVTHIAEMHNMCVCLHVMRVQTSSSSTFEFELAGNFLDLLKEISVK